MTKVTKMSFSNIQGVLSRDEMRKIMAGSQGGSSCGVCWPTNSDGTPQGTPQGCIQEYGVCMGCGGLCW
jgi:hypothetical protein